jgi:lycopene cyclase domain-containing protein
VSLYFLIMIATILGPFALSFDKKVAFYKKWRLLFPTILVASSIYLIWDEIYTRLGVWGFNPDYLQGIYIGNLPLEEICFFLFVPYACVFIYACLLAYFPKADLKKASPIIAGFVLVICASLTGFFLENLYTAAASIAALSFTILFYYVFKVEWYGRFILTFLIVQIPFFIVNGALTGMFTPEPIVWYNETEIMGPRWISIPMEDTIYNYSFLILVFYFYHLFQKRPKVA